MSLSLAAKGGHDPVNLSRQDLLLAAVLHVIVIVAIVVLTLWQPHALPLPPKALEVRLISPDMLKKMKLKPAVARAKLMKAAKAKALPKDYDPFAPLVSTTKTPAKPATQISPSLSADLRGQLSEKEMDRYIAMIQTAVQENWKISADMKANEDPVVSMELNPNGAVRRLEVVVSSGSPAMDESLIRAIRSAAPFTLPRQQFEVFRTNRMRFHPLR